MLIRKGEAFRVFEGPDNVEELLQRTLSRGSIGFIINIATNDGLERLLFEPDGTSLTSDELSLYSGKEGGFGAKCSLIIPQKQPFRDLVRVVLLA